MQSEHDTTFTDVATNVRFYLFSVTRIDDFFKYIYGMGGGVHRLEIENRLDIYAEADEEIHFEH